MVLCASYYNNFACHLYKIAAIGCVSCPCIQAGSQPGSMHTTHTHKVVFHNIERFDCVVHCNQLLSLDTENMSEGVWLILGLPAAIHCLEQLIECRRLLDTTVLETECLYLKWLILENE